MVATKPSFKLVWTGPRDVIEAGATLLSEAFAEAFDAVSIGAASEEGAEAESVWRLEAYGDGARDIDAWNQRLEAVEPRWSKASGPEAEEIPEIDWVAHALEGLGVVHAGRFVLYGEHDAAEVRDLDDEEISIRIDANQAFGTGHHPTTAGCLELLSRFAGFAPKSVLDLGCGSAVLAIAAAKLWGRQVVASDIDDASVVIARENASLNGVGEMINIVHAEGFAHAAIEEAAPYDFVFANILAGPLVELAPAAATHLKKNGRIMLAGLMAEQETSVTSAYEAAGFRLLNRLAHKTWPVLLFVQTS